MGSQLFCLRFGRNTGQKGNDVSAHLIVIVRRVVTLKKPVKVFGTLPTGTTLDQFGQRFPGVANDAPALDKFGAPLNFGFVLGGGCCNRQGEGRDEQKQRKAQHYVPAHWRLPLSFFVQSVCGNMIIIRCGEIKPLPS
jgi:hypothetical protein